MKKNRPFISYIYTALVFIFLYAPIVVLVIYSFNASSSTSVMSGFSLKWYKELFGDKGTMQALRNSLLIAVLSSILATVLGTAASVGINGMKNKYVRSAVMSVTNVPMMNPDIVTGISLLLLFVFGAGLLKIKSVLGFQTILIAHITFNLPYVILSVLPKLRQMDKHLSEAALDLGCTPFQSFFKVVLPTVRPGIVTGMIMSFTLSLDDFIISYFVSGPQWQTLPIKLFSMTKKRVKPDMYALSTLIFFAVLVLLFLINMSKRRGEIRKNKNEI